MNLDNYSQGIEFEETTCPSECDKTLCEEGCIYADD